MPGIWHLGGLTFGQLARRVWTDIQRDDVFGQSAKLSFFFLLALFPFLLVLTTLFGYVTHAGELRAGLLDYFRGVAPRSASHLIVDTMNQISSGATGGKLSFGIVFTLWMASSGMSAAMEGMNTAYGVQDTRPWWKQRFVALVLTIGSALFTVVALVIIVAGPKVGELLARSAGYEGAFVTLWHVGRWPVAIAISLIAINLLYRFAPDRRGFGWRWMVPGTSTAIALWIVASLGFRLYLRYFNSYNVTYGSLGAVIILLLWLYMTGAAVLVGAEVNAEIEAAAARSGEPGAHIRGEKRAGDKRLRRRGSPPSEIPKAKAGGGGAA